MNSIALPILLLTFLAVVIAGLGAYAASRGKRRIGLASIVMAPVLLIVIIVYFFIHLG